MTPTKFVKEFLPQAIETEKKTGIPGLAILSMAALESGWGRVAPGNMFFGVKDTDGLNGNEQLLTTTEFSRRNDLQFPVIISVTPVLRGNQKWYRYRIKDYFRKYKSPEESFTDHANFLIRNKRYAKALEVKHDPSLFLAEVAKAGYATDPEYNNKLQSILIKVSQLAEAQKPE